MRNKIIIILIIIVSIAGCTKKNHVPPPDDLIEKQQLIPVIIDLHLANAIQTEKPALEDSKTAEIERLYKYIWEKHHITSKQFEESIKYYSTNPDEMKAMYKIVLDSLQNIKAKTKKHQHKEKES